MPRATLTVTVPEDVWIGGVTREHPEARVRVLAVLPEADRGVVLAEVVAPDARAVVGKFAAAGAVDELSVLRRTDDRALVEFETTAPMLMVPVRESGVPLETPFAIQDGRAEWEVTASHRRLSELGDQLDAFGIQYTVEEVSQQIEPDQVLTDRQLALVRAAAERGYYDTPRETTLTELADDLGLAKSTCSETLHRAEGAIVDHFLEEVDRDVEEAPEVPAGE